MKIIHITAPCIAFFLLLVLPCAGQRPNAAEKEGRYTYTETFNSIFYPGGNREYRTVAGSPSARYWQNSTDYKIEVSLNGETDEIKGQAVLTYKNNSPDTLDFVWLYLEQNLFREDSRGGLLITEGGTRPNPNAAKFEGGFKIKSVKEISADGKTYIDAKYMISDTRMQVWLQKKILPQKGEATLRIEYSYICPVNGASRTGIQFTKNGKIYSIAQWYPRMCVYDDVLGWNTIPYTGAGEFYSDYGNFDIRITAPDSHMVLCSGELLNPAEVYTQSQLARWEQAKLSDKAVTIRTAGEIGAVKATSPARYRTWHYAIKNARDAAWASSPAFIITAARINLPSGKKSMAISAYPVESDSANAWQRATEYVKASIEYSSGWFEYPYPAAINIASSVGGMEYPGIVFCGWERKGQRLWNVTDHEQGHNLFPIIVGSNEKLHGWMDEGMNVFLNRLSTDEFNGGEYKGGYTDMHKEALYFTNPGLEPVMSAVSHIKSENRATLLYFKPAAGLRILRSKILGEEKFDPAFKTYIQRWAYKHPTPEDFFRTMENVSGEDLSWFWRSWFLNNWQLDQAIKDVQIIRNDTASGIRVTIANLEKAAMPVELELKYKTGKKERFKLPVEIWESHESFTIHLPCADEPESVTLDPDKALPDINPRNNIWIAGNAINTP